MNTIKLISRTGLNLAEISKEDFVKFMAEDIKAAHEKYNELYRPEWEQRNAEHKVYVVERAKENATKYAERKWKTEKKRQPYIEAEIEKAKNHLKDLYYDDLTFFDFDVNPGSMGINGTCILDAINTSKKALEMCYDTIKDAKYFKQASGWSLEYDVYGENTYRTAFRPHIQLTGNNVEAEMKADKEALAKSVREFYKNTTYFGD